MSYSKKYYLDYTDYYGQLTEVSILERDYSGSASALTGSGNPLTIEMLNVSDNIFQKIRGTQAILRIIDTAGDTYTDLFSPDPKKYKIEVYKTRASRELFWAGFIMPDQFSQPYKYPPYEIELTFSDGLGMLKDIPFQASDGSLYTGLVTVREIIGRIVNKIELTLDLYDGWDIVENSIGSTMIWSRDVFVNCDKYIKWKEDPRAIRRFKYNAKIGSSLSCYEVLEDVIPLTGYFTQSEGHWCLYRWGAYITYRREGLYTSESYNYLGSLETYDRKLLTTDTTETDNRVLLIGNNLMINPSLKKFLIKQNFGLKESILNNWDFSSFTTAPANPTNANFSNWTKSSSSLILGVFAIDEKPCCYIANYNSTRSGAKYIQSDGVPVTDDYGLRITIEWGNREDNGENWIIVYVAGSGGIRYLKNDGTWSVNSEWVRVGNFATGDSLETFTIGTQTIPIDGDLYVQLYQSIVGGAAFYGQVKVLPSDDIAISDLTIDVSVDERNNYSESFEINIGDVPAINLAHIIYRNGIFLNAFGLTSSAWDKRSENEAESFIIKIGELISEQLYKQRQQVSGKIYSKLFNFDTILVDAYNGGIYLQPIYIKLDDKMQIWEAEMAEIENYGSPIVDENLEAIVDESGNEIFG